MDGESYYDIQPLGNSVYAMTTTEIVRLTLETPNRLSFFSNKEQVQLPEDAQQEQQTQEELDLLQSILDGMEQQSDELTVGESGEQQLEKTQEEQTQSELPAEEEQQEQSEPSTDSEQQAQEESPAEETEQSNQEPSHVTVQNEDSQPEYSSEDQTQSPQEEQDDSQQDQGGFFSSRPAQ